ncbi:MAG: cyclic nucleotide-binding domain-containing protein, partial [Myxococcales bacterium]|nr:cyclic nucleotide-binding domain-containing protein [Myxococcales bacterium]
RRPCLASAPPPPPPAATKRQPPSLAARRPDPITLDSLSLPPSDLASQPAKAPQQSIPQAPPAPDVADIYSDALVGAPELTVDPAAKPDETRFSMAPEPPRDSLTFELSDAEFEPRSLPPAHESLPPEPSANALSKLPLFPLFADVGKEALADMLRDASLIEAEHGEMVARTGEPSDALFGILEGSVRVIVPGQKIQLTLTEGDVFGEGCLLEDQPRHANAIAQGRLVALRIPRQVLHGLIQKHPRVAEILLALLTRRLLGNLLQTSPLFSEFSGPERTQLARTFEVRRAAAGTQLALVGKSMDALYIALTGKLRVEIPGAPARSLGPGHMFGQAALLSREPSRADITAEVNMIVLRLPVEMFSQIALSHPMVLAQLSELADEDVVKVTT